MQTPGDVVAENVVALRKARGMSVRAMSERLAGIGYRMLPSSITTLEQGKRRATADDLVALALVLQVTPNRLLLPARADHAPVSLTPEVTVPASLAWAWANGSVPIHSAYPADDTRTQAEQTLEFQRTTQPVEHQIRASHPAWQAVHRLLEAVETCIGGKPAPETSDRLAREARRVRDEITDLLDQTR